MVAMSWTAWELTHSTTWLAIIAVLDIVPNLIFLPLGGVMADRFDRLRILLVSYGAAWFHVLALMILAYTGTLTILPLAVLAVLHGFIHSFSVPAAYGLMPRFIARERLSSAIAVNAAYSQFAVLPARRLRAGLSCITALSPPMPPMWWAISSTLSRCRFSARRKTMSNRRQWALDLRRYRRWPALHRRHRGISALLLLMLMGDALSTAVYQMLPAIADGCSAAASRHVEPAVGGRFRRHAVGPLARSWRRGTGNGGPRLWSTLAFTLSAGALISPFISTWRLPYAGLWLCGRSAAFGTISILQIAVSDEQRGRLMSTQFMLQRFAGGIGTVLVGFVAEETVCGSRCWWRWGWRSPPGGWRSFTGKAL